MSNELLDNLTPIQASAATHIEGPALVLAGPGSGKTRVVTHRVAFLVREAGVAPWQILAITFTNKAAGEMRERLGHLLTEKQARACTMSTFHSFCARLLRQHGEGVGLPPGFSIYDTVSQRKLLKQSIESLDMKKMFTPAGVQGSISNAKNAMQGPDEFLRNATSFASKKLGLVYQEYERLLQQSKAVDFDDLLLKTVRLLRGDDELRQRMTEHFQHVLIDEYQDTNRVQFELASLLASPKYGGHGNLMATGDPDQSIYGWRGADIRNILDFEASFPGAAVYRLEQNYRSTGHILAAADTLIRHNSQRRHKELFSELGEGEPIVVSRYDGEEQEAQGAVNFLKECREQNHLEWSDCAIFYRNNSLSRALEEVLRDEGIPYQIVRGTAFFDRKEIRDAVAYLSTIVNPADEVSLTRIINTPARGISAATVNTLQATSSQLQRPLGELICDAEQISKCLPARAAKAVTRFADTLQNWRSQLGLPTQGNTEGALIAPDLGDFVQIVLEESGLVESYKLKSDDTPDEDREANLSELVAAARNFEESWRNETIDIEADPFGDPLAPPPAERRHDSLHHTLLAYLERISLVSDADGRDESIGAVTLMTLHASKGLEFPAVAIIGLEEGLLPNQRAMDEGKDKAIEEERRLLFVGITRAMRHLHLTHSKGRFGWGGWQGGTPSRFIAELPKEHLHITIEQNNNDGRSSTLSDTVHTEHGEFAAGTHVRHPNFGRGVVKNVAATGRFHRITVAFNQGGTRTLILEYAQLEAL